MISSLIPKAESEWREMAVEARLGSEWSWQRAEANIIESARQGDTRAFALLWMRYEPKIAAFTRHLCGHYHLNRSDDALGEVYLAVARSISTFDLTKTRNPNAGAAFCSWAYRIAARVVVAHVVKGQRVATTEVTVEDWEGVPKAAATGQSLAEDLVLRETVDRIYDHIENDGNTERATYLRLIGEGATQQEAAVVLGINPSTGRSWLKRFRLDLEAEQDGHADSALRKQGQKNA